MMVATVLKSFYFLQNNFHQKGNVCILKTKKILLRIYSNSPNSESSGKNENMKRENVKIDMQLIFKYHPTF